MKYFRREWKGEIKNEIVNYLEKKDQDAKKPKSMFLRNNNLTIKKNSTELEENSLTV